MKKSLLTLTGIALLTGLLAYPVFAYNGGGGWRGCQNSGQGYQRGGGGYHHMGQGQGYHHDGPRLGYNKMTTEQQEKFDALSEKFAADTNELREDARLKSIELSGVLAANEPDAEKAIALKKELNALRNDLSEKRMLFSLEVRKDFPDSAATNFFCNGQRSGRWLR